MSGRTFIALAILTLLALSPAQAADVTVCTTSIAPGGVNLEQAVAQGGQVGFACGGTPAIEVIRSIYVTRATTLDGHRAVTLKMSHTATGPMFEVQHAAPFVLGGLRLEGRHVLLLGAAASTYADIVRALAASVTLHDTTVTNATIAIRADSASIQGSTFTDNGTGSVVRTLRLEDSTITNGSSGFTVNGPAEIRHSTFRNLEFEALSVSGAGCNLKIAASRFENNGKLPVFPIVRSGCPTQIVSSHFIGNQGSHGGALSLAPPSGGAPVDVSIRSSEFRNNKARLYGAAVGLEGPGAVNLDIRNVEFDDNSAPTGGGIGMDKLGAPHSVRVVHSIFRNNTATGAGGALALRGATLAAAQVNFRDNKASRGGALYLAQITSSPILLGNIILVGNQAPSGAAIAFTGRLDLRNATLARNIGGPAIVGDLDPADVTAAAGHTLVRALSAGNTIFLDNAAPVCGVPLSGRGNIQFPDGGCGSSAAVVNPLLDELMVPLPGGGALGHGILDICLAAPVSAHDFYGLRRPRGVHCSIGAVEGELDSFTSLIRNLERGRELPWARNQRPRRPEPDGTRLRLD